MSKIASFKSVQNKGLHAALDAQMSARGFKSTGVGSRTDYVGWEKAVGATMSAWLNINLNLSSSPPSWTLDMHLAISSRFVAQQSARLRLDRDCWRKPDEWVEPDTLQIMSVLPGYLHWQDNPSLTYKTLSGCSETMQQLCDEMGVLVDRYVLPVLDRMASPASAAQFHEEAFSGMRAVRGPAQPRYEVNNAYISTALLWMEAGCPERALAFLEGALDQKAEIQGKYNAEFAGALFCKIEKLVADLRAPA